MEENNEIQQIEQESPPLCGGVKMPEIPPGEAGYYSCVGEQWVFFPL